MFYRQLHGSICSLTSNKETGFVNQVGDQFELVTCDLIFTKKLLLLKPLTPVTKYFKIHPENERSRFTLDSESKVPATLHSGKISKGRYSIKIQKSVEFIVVINIIIFANDSLKVFLAFSYC